MTSLDVFVEGQQKILDTFKQEWEAARTEDVSTFPLDLPVEEWLECYHRWRSVRVLRCLACTIKNTIANYPVTDKDVICQH